MGTAAFRTIRMSRQRSCFGAMRIRRRVSVHLDLIAAKYRRAYLACKRRTPILAPPITRFRHHSSIRPHLLGGLAVSPGLLLGRTLRAATCSFAPAEHKREPW